MDQESKTLVAAIQKDNRPVDKDEEDLRRLRQLNPDFDSSDLLPYIESMVRARRFRLEFLRQHADPLSKDVIRQIVDAILNQPLPQHERLAYLYILQDEVYSDDVGDAIYWQRGGAWTTDTLMEALFENR